MDIGAASALNLYNYQTTAQTSNQSAAVLQALAQTYSGAAASGAGLFDGSDALSALVGSSSTQGLLTNGIYSASQTNGSTSFSTAGLSASGFGGLDASSASGLLSSLGTNSTGASNGLAGLTLSDLNPSLASAIASYQYQQSIGSGTAATSTSTANQLVQAAQSTQTSGALNLLA